MEILRTANRLINKEIDELQTKGENIIDMIDEIVNKTKILKTQPKTWEHNIHKVEETYNKKFNCWFDDYQVELSTTAVDIDPVKVFMTILNKVKEERGLVNGDKIRLIVSHKSLVKFFSSGLLKVMKD